MGCNGWLVRPRTRWFSDPAKTNCGQVADNKQRAVQIFSQHQTLANLVKRSNGRQHEPSESYIPAATSYIIQEWRPEFRVVHQSPREFMGDKVHKNWCRYSKSKEKLNLATYRVNKTTKPLLRIQQRFGLHKWSRSGSGGRINEVMLLCAIINLFLYYRQHILVHKLS